MNAVDQILQFTAPSGVAVDLLRIHDIDIPVEKSYLIQALQQDLALRARAISTNSMTAYKRGVLIEGDSGLGKSRLLRELLMAEGFIEDAPDPQKRFCVINAGSTEVPQLLKRAFDEGSIVILDELNLDPSLEEQLNRLLTDARAKPGFMVFSSQNGGHFVGRKALSNALKNRCHYIHMDPFSHKELVALAQAAQHPDPKGYAGAYRKAHEEHPEHIKERTFYGAVGWGKLSNPSELRSPNSHF